MIDRACQYSTLAAGFEVNHTGYGTRCNPSSVHGILLLIDHGAASADEDGTAVNAVAARIDGVANLVEGQGLAYMAV
jgi:hypothetical protein